MDRVGIRFDEAEELGEILVPFDRVEAFVGPQLVIAVQVDTGAVQDHGRHVNVTHTDVPPVMLVPNRT